MALQLLMDDLWDFVSTNVKFEYHHASFKNT
jgi:hypothetical protein